MPRVERLTGWRCWVGLVLLGGAAVSALAADTPPVLLSPTGDDGGPRTVAELIAAAEAGHSYPAFQYAQLLELGAHDVPQDFVRALHFYRIAAEGGEPNARFRLGKVHHDGLLGVPRDYARAMAYYRSTVPAIPEAIYNLGAMYVSGRGVRRDWTEGLAWLLVATDHGLGEAAVAQVKQRLARQPATIAAAEKRAEALRVEIASPSRPSVPEPGARPEAAPAPPRPRVEVERPAPPSLAAPKLTLEPPRPTIALPPPPPPLRPRLRTRGKPLYATQ
jgi:uncharacterized protein